MFSSDVKASAASAAASLFGLLVIVAVNRSICSCVVPQAQTASIFYRNTCSTMSSRRVECVKLRSSVMMMIEPRERLKSIGTGLFIMARLAHIVPEDCMPDDP
jgi:lipopolysaccharide/colanic/teichoic acid biosynthesis glycosyltransferase